MSGAQTFTSSNLPIVVINTNGQTIANKPFELTVSVDGREKKIVQMKQGVQKIVLE